MADDQPVRRPNPDPTQATILLIDTRISSFKENVYTRFESMDRAQKLFEDNLTRVPTALDKGIQTQREYTEARLAELKLADDHSTAQRELILKHIEENLNNAKAFFQMELTSNKQLYMEKFEAIVDTIQVLKDTINDRFTQNDQNTEKAFNAAKQAVGERDASNAASANKSEANLAKLIGALEDNVKTLSVTTDARIGLNKSNTDDKIGDLKDQIARLDTRISSGESSRRGSGESVIWLFGGVSAIASLAAVIAVIFALTHHP